MKKIVFVKLGGSLITDKGKPFTARVDVIKNLAQQISQALTNDPQLKLVVGNGGGSFPHYPAVKYKMSQGIQNEEQKIGFCEVQDAAAQLNRLIVRALLNVKVKAISVNPSSMIIAREGKIKKFFIEPIIQFLKLGLTPVLYGDIVYDQVLGAKIFSTEQLLTALTIQFRKKGFPVEKIIHNGITVGILDRQGNLIETITKKNINNLWSVFTETEGFDVTGGMIHKVKEALKLTKIGIKTLIINGNAEKNLLRDAILGVKVKGTMVI